MPKKVIRSKGKKTPGTIMAEGIRTRANKLKREERESLLAAAMKIISRPADFAEALDDFAHGRFVSMGTALNETPPEKTARDF